MEEIKNRLNPIFQKIFKDPSISITEETTANDVENWSSLNHMDLIHAVENEFKIKFNLREVIRMDNVGDLMKTIQSKSL
ncbi:MAG: acyl carrier protein [Bacteroidota bacterium]